MEKILVWFEVEYEKKDMTKRLLTLFDDIGVFPRALSVKTRASMKDAWEDK